MTKFVLPLLLVGVVVSAQGFELRDPTPAEHQALARRMEKLGSLSLEAHINLTVLEVPAGANPHAADVRGAALVYMLDQDACAWNDDSRGPCWVLAFGDWPHATRDGDMLNYHFQHKNLTPYVENVVIHMRGAEDRIEEMLQKADWPLLVDGFTK